MTNTARLAPLALERVALIDWGIEDQPVDISPFLGPYTWMLFPDGHDATGPVVPARRAHRGIPSPPPQCVVLLDGSWAQARKMAHRVPQVQGLRRFMLPAPERPGPRLRHPPHPEGMSSLEAIARTLEAIEGPEISAPIDALLARFVGQVRRLSPGLGEAAWEKVGG